MDDEYIDYSCSTAVERLSRDVESFLRQWHIHDGCDRHFSIATHPHGVTLLRSQRFTWIATLPPSSSASPNNNNHHHHTPTTVQLELQLTLWDGPATRRRGGAAGAARERRQSDGDLSLQKPSGYPSLSPSSTPDSTPTKKKKKNKKNNKNKKKKQRSPRERHRNRRSSLTNDECVASALKSTSLAGLQDLPAIKTYRSNKYSSMDDSAHTVHGDAASYGGTTVHEEEEDDELHKHLPKSLQRSNGGGTDMPESLFDNFSTLFGIGQHITLTPVHATMELHAQSNSSDSHGVGGGFASLLQNLLQRHEPAQARWVATQLLANWLQSALNAAAVNCQSCIPMFGFWGHYPCRRSSTHNEKASVSMFPAWLDAARAFKEPLARAEHLWQHERKKKQQQQSASNSPSKFSFSTRRRKRRNSIHQGSPNESPPSLQASSGSSTSSNEDAAHHIPAVSPQQALQSMGRSRNAHYAPPIVTGSVVPTGSTHASFSCSVLPQPLITSSVDSLSTWGNLLLQHCNTNSYTSSYNNNTVILSGARHVYSWWKQWQSQQNGHRNQEVWRGLDPKDFWKQQAPERMPHLQASLADEIHDYRILCRASALDLMEQAIGGSSWGPRQDPIHSLRATLVWESSNTNDALASFSSEVRSSPLSFESLMEMRTPTKFTLQAFLDHQALEPTLATSQRCVLACLIRSSTLAPLTLSQHLLWEDDIVDDWDHEAGNVAAAQVAQQAKVGDATQTLVDVMDWKTCAEEMISEDEAEAIVREVMDGAGYFAFPSPPENMFSVTDPESDLYNNCNHPLLEPLFQSAPVGRLLSDLFLRMGQLRTPCSMALVWSTFCDELRYRWDVREPLQNMHYVPGLDPSPSVLSKRRSVSTIGVKADLAAFWKCTEADPDDQHCLIGQKLQVFNIVIEAMAALESRQQLDSYRTNADGDFGLEDMDCSEQTQGSSIVPARARSLVSMASSVAGGMPTIIDDESARGTLESTRGGTVVNLSSLGSQERSVDLFGQRGRRNMIIDGFLPDDDLVFKGSSGIQEERSITSDTASMEFFDAEECGMSVFSGTSYFTRNLATTVVHRIERKGARCPVHGCSLVASGDQVYAPYLQRPEPLTDDMILERRMMLSEESFASELGKGETRVPVQKRLEIAYRLQKPKLLSDMNAFKAANPGAIFQDFVSWYGNPGNPLEDYRCGEPSIDLETTQTGFAKNESVAIKLDKATEAIHILNETRNFWSSTWDEAVAAPASEQNPLFEVFTTVEKLLDYLGNMHPAVLMNQVMAVNLANAYFLLVTSAKDATKVNVVDQSLRRLRKLTEEALQILSEEAANATNGFHNSSSKGGGGLANFVSIESLAACEAVCSSLSEAEVIVALATSLLQKFPAQYDIVQGILRHADGDIIELHDTAGQRRILEAIRQQQIMSGKTMGRSHPKPVLREYVLQNLDDANPCQLSVRYGDASVSDGSSSKGGLMLALTKSVED